MTIQIPISKRVRRHNSSEHWDKSQLFLKGEPRPNFSITFVTATSDRICGVTSDPCPRTGWGNLKIACEDWISCAKFQHLKDTGLARYLEILREADACWVFQIPHLLASEVGKGIARFRVCCKPTGAEFVLENFSDLQKYFAESCQRNEVW